MFTSRSRDNIRFDLLTLVRALGKFCSSWYHVCLYAFSGDGEVRVCRLQHILVEPRETSVSGVVMFLVTLHLAKLLLRSGCLHRINRCSPRGYIHQIIPTLHGRNRINFSASTAHQRIHLSRALSLIGRSNATIAFHIFHLARVK